MDNKNEEIELMKNEIKEIYVKTEKNYLEKCRELANILNLFGLEEFDYYTEYKGHSILQYRIYNTHRIWMFENLQNEGNVIAINEDIVIAINEDIVKENVKTKPLDWIIRRTNSILNFLYDYNDIYSNLFNNSYKSLKRDYEYLKNKYENYKNQISNNRKD